MTDLTAGGADARPAATDTKTRIAVALASLIQAHEDERDAAQALVRASTVATDAQRVRLEALEKAEHVTKKLALAPGCCFSFRGYQFRVMPCGSLWFEREPEPLEHVFRDRFGVPDFGATTP